MKDVLAKDNTLANTVLHLTSSIEETRSLMTTINTTIATIQSNILSVQSNIENLTTSLVTLSDSMTSITQRISTLEQSIVDINTMNQSQSLALTQMQDLTNQLQSELSELRHTIESNTGSTENTTIVNHYNTYIQTGSTNTGETTIINNYYITGTTDQTGSLVWTHSLDLLNEVMSGTTSTNTGTDISPKEAYLYILNLYESATDTIENLVALQVTSIHGYFNEIWVKKINTENIVTENLCIGTTQNHTCITKEQLDLLLSKLSNNSDIELSAPSDTVISQDSNSSSGTYSVDNQDN